MVELRKRKTPPPAPEKPARKPKTASTKDSKIATEKPTASKVKEPEAATTKTGEPEITSKPAAKSASKKGKPEVDDTIDLDGFGGTVSTQDGKSVTLKDLVDQSEAGVVLFTYPKASTPGCTTQVCAFRDDYKDLTSTGLSIYGLSGDSPKANTTFHTKQSLPYPLLCDPDFTLIGAIGLRKSATEKKTSRGVFVVDKSGRVLIAEQGGPLLTVAAVRKLVQSK